MAPKQPIHVTVTTPAPPVPPDKMKAADLLGAWNADHEDETLAREVSNRTGGWYVANADGSVAVAETVDLIALYKRGEVFKGPMWGSKPLRKVADRATSSAKVRFNPYRPTNPLTPSGFDPALNITFPTSDMATMVKHSFVGMSLETSGVTLTEDDIADISEEVQGTRQPRRSVKRALAAMALAEADDDPEGTIAAARRRLTTGVEVTQPVAPFAGERGVVPQASRPSSFDLTGPQRRDLREALLSAFPSWESLDRMVTFGLVDPAQPQHTVRLDVIVGRGAMGDVAFHLIEWCAARSLIGTLIDAAARANPGNQKLRAFVAATAPQTIDPIDKMNKLLPAQFDELVYRLGIPPSMLSGSTAPQGQRSREVFQWAQQDSRRMADLLARLS